jgi:hypothetical protein
MAKRAAKLDDDKSEASTIALGLRSVCASEFARSRDIFARAQGLNPAATQMFRRQDDEAFMHEATTAVLIERANRQR